MPLPDDKFLVSDDAKNSAKMQQNKTGSLKFVGVVRKLITDVEKVVADVESLGTQKADTNNLKTSYKQFAEDTNRNIGTIDARLNAIEELLKQTIAKLNELDDV